MTHPSDREKLIEEAAKAMWSDPQQWATITEPVRDDFRGMARAALTVFEERWSHTQTVNVDRAEWDRLKANQGAIVNSIIERTRHEATGDEREALANMIPLDLVHDRGREGFPKDVFEVADHILAAGFHRSEPQGEPSDAPKRLVYEVNMLLSSVASHGPAALTDTSDRMYTPGLLRRLRDALDPNPAQRLAAGNAVRAEMARNGLDVHRMVYGQEIANVLASAALDAALRAAGEVNR